MDKNYKGTIVEESLEDNRILNEVQVLSSRISKDDSPADRWHLYNVKVSKEDIQKISKYIKPGKWYMHFWRNKDVVAVFKDKVFEFNYDDKSTWKEVVAYGQSLGIPDKQLDFIIENNQEKVPLEIFAIYFSPYTAHAIKIDGLLYPTVEHAYQCQRYADKRIIEEIRSAHSPVKAWETSSKYKSVQIPEFKKDEYKLEVMKKIMRLKAEQHEDVRKALIDSIGKQIVKHITTHPPGDGFWDDGESGEGLNHTGRMWMEIREELKKK